MDLIPFEVRRCHSSEAEIQISTRCRTHKYRSGYRGLTSTLPCQTKRVNVTLFQRNSNTMPKSHTTILGYAQS
jgi:hypothetical protein